MKQIILCCVCYMLINTAFAQYNYPFTKTVDSSDTYFGVSYKDPYRWLENLKDTNVLQWFKQQTDFADAATAKLAGTDSFISRFLAYSNSKTWGCNPQYKYGNRYYYDKWERGQLSQNLYYRTGTDTTGHFIFDSWKIHDGMRYFVEVIKFSPNGKYFAATFDKNGEEYPFIKIYDLENKKWLSDSIPHCWTNTIFWTSDSKGLIYSYNTGDRTAANASVNDVSKYHLLHTNYMGDITIMSELIRNTIEKKKSNSYYSFIYNINGSDKIYCQPNQGFDFEYGNLYFIKGDQLLAPSKHWTKLYDQKDSVADIKETPLGYYFVCAKGNGFKSLRFTPANNPDFANATILLAEDPTWQLEKIDETKSFLLVYYSKYGFINKTIFINKKTGKEVVVSAIKDLDRHAITTMGTQTDECIFWKQYINKPGWSYLLDIGNNKLIREQFWAPRGQTFLPGSEDIVSELIEVPSYDGTLVPLSILRSKYTKFDGNNIVLLYGYGAYGISVKDNSYNDYSPINNLLVKAGVILAHAYVRGGGEKGEAWHKDGMKENKSNTWKDFIACAEYLIKNKYTQSSRLACQGGSAGGVLIGRTITERPDLFAAAHIQSGCVNQIRGKAWGNQINNYPEYGNPAIESEMKGIIEMDAVIHVKPNVKYPAVYLTTGINDMRVAPWMPGKMAASLQANSTSGKPVLLYTNFEGGHFGDANAPTLKERMKTGLAPVFFLLWQCGHKGFQLDQ